MNVAGWVDANLERFGDHDAVVIGEQVWTSAALHERACRLASALTALGVAPGERVLLPLANDIDMVVAFEATLRCGAVAVPLFAGAPPGELERYVALATPSAIVAAAGLPAAAAAALTAIPLRIEAGAAAPPGWRALDSLLGEYEPLTAPAVRDPGDVAVVSYTSGTSGSPKGVAHTHASIAARHGGTKARRVPGRVLVALPLNSLGAGMLTGRLAHQWTLILLDTFEPRAFVSAVTRHRATTIVLMPSMGEAIAALPDLADHDLSSLRYVGFTGAHVPAPLLARLAAVLPVAPAVAYGMTETGGAIAASGLASKPGSAGRIAKGVDVKIVGEDGAERAAGDVGEILVRTPWMGAGYYAQPDETAAAFTDGWLRTGDLGYIDADRELFVVGRRKDLIIQNGVKIHPHDIVEVLRLLPGAGECAVVGLPHPLLGEQVAACITPLPGVTITSDQVLAHCRERLDPRKVPVRVWFGELPKSVAGKIRLQDLRALLTAESDAVRDCPAFRQLQAALPSERLDRLRTIVHTQLVRVLPSRTGDAPPPVDTNATFGELGLDSLRVAQLAQLLDETLGRPIAPTLFFSHPTLDALCRHLASHVLDLATAPARAVAPLPRQAAASSPVAIVGLACRLPGGVETPEQYWSLLQRGLDASAEISRWDMDGVYDPARGTPGKSYTRRAALLADVEHFDAGFFELTTREASRLDPQHRLVLEVAWETVENAGYDPRTLSASATPGLFLGISAASSAGGDGFGAAPSMAVARVCHLLDWRGPAMAVDTSCSSSLTAIHYAVQSLRLGECDLAIAGGVQLIGSPRSFVALCEVGLMAADGRCKAFDASADGFGRGEGCVMVALKRLADAEAAGDRVIAVIRGSAVRHDGRSASLTAPNGRAQQDVIRAALGDARVAPGDVDYLEAHGTGTALGDPTELGAALAVLGDPTRRLVVGSVKTNIGHLETAAGAAGLVKVALALERAEIPAHLHCRALNPLLEPLAASFVIPQETMPWPRRGRRVAGVTSMGLSGTNVHVVLEEAPSPPDAGTAGETTPQLLCLSARTETALRTHAARLADHLAGEPASFADTCFTANAGRARFPHRLAVVVNTAADARKRLREYAEGTGAAIRTGAATTRPKVGFAFTGIGSQFAGMGRQLYDTEPVFRAALDRCADILQPRSPRPLLEAIYAQPRPDDPPEHRIDEMAIGQPALFAFEWALSELWRSWGIEPDVVVGHSVGECVAACVAGLLTLEDGLALAAARGRLMQSLTDDGAMVSCAADEARVRASIDGVPSVAVAAINGPRTIVIAGARPALRDVVAALAADGVATRWLTIPRACHSPLMDPILDEFEAVARGLTFLALERPIISTLTGRPTTAEDMSRPEYWRRQLREPVQFAAASAAIADAGCTLVVEVGAQPVLTPLARDSAATGRSCRWLPSLRGRRGDREQMLAALGDLYVHGVDPDWSRIYAGQRRRRVALPTYPFERTRLRRSPAQSGAGLMRDDVGRPPGGAGRAAIGGRTSPPPDAATLVATVRRHVAAVVGRDPESIAVDANCLDLGMDSLAVVDVVAAVRRATAAACTPADFMARPTVADFAAFVGARLTKAGGDAAPASCPSVATLNGRGSRVPIFCMHPSGGQATAYVRLRALLGEDQPLYALQSRALDDPSREYPTIAAMAAAYADVVRSIQPTGPYRLLGWSMGGLIAHAVAGELERHGAPVAMVGMVDTLITRATSTNGPVLGELEFVLAAIIGEVQPSRAPRSLMTSGLADADTIPRDALLAWCEENGHLPTGVFTNQTFQLRLRLYERHFQMVRAHRPSTIDAPILCWRAQSSRRPFDWSAFTRGGVFDDIVGGNHFSVMQPPYIERIAAAIAAGVSPLTTA